MTPTIRYPDWDRRMVAEISRQRHGEFVHGSRDCCTFAADLVKAMTGFDPADGLRGTYSTQEEAIAIIERGGGMQEFISDMLRCESIPKESAMRGDICLMKTPSAMPLDQVGVCVGDSVLVASSECLCHRDLKHAVCCWRIE